MDNSQRFDDGESTAATREDGMAERSRTTEPAGGAGDTPSAEVSDAAKRALAEADERRRLRGEAANAAAARQEVGGRNGPDPVRFGDWEKNGLISDF